MSAKRWLLFIVSIIVGITIGLYYGWVISPVQYVDTTPATLRVDYRADYVLMVAETYQAEGSLENAARRLAILGSQPPSQMVSAAIGFAREHHYSQPDTILLQNLAAALQVWKPESNPLPSETTSTDTTSTPPAPANGAKP